MAGKSVRSGKLSYSKPRIDVNQPPMPSPATLVDPISYIRFWDKYNHGEPVDITKAKKMTRDSLLKADPRGIELMLAHGVPWRQIATQYNTPRGSLTSIFKRLGVNTKVEPIVETLALMDLPEDAAESAACVAESVEEDPAEDLLLETEAATTITEASSYEPVPTELKQAIDESPYKNFTWFYGQKPNPVVTICFDGRFSVPAIVRKSFVNCLISIGISPSGRQLVIAVVSLDPNDQHGFRIKPRQFKYRDIAISKKLSDIPINLPARYRMTWNEGKQVWDGVLLP